MIRRNIFHISTNESKVGKYKGHTLSASIVKIITQIKQRQASAKNAKGDIIMF